MSRKGTNFEHAFIEKEEAKGRHCERVAGSGSRREAICDVVLFKEGKTYLVEVKSTLKKKFYVGKSREQLEKLQSIAVKHGTIPLLAIRFKRREWNEIRLDQIQGIPKVFCPQSSVKDSQPKKKQSRQAQKNTTEPTKALQPELNASSPCASKIL